MASAGLTQAQTPYSTPMLRPSTHRTPSISSSSRSDSWDSFLESPLFSFNDPSSPLHTPIPPLKLLGIPFSWEQTPGIPKNHQGFKKAESSSRRGLLPLPPASTTKKWRAQEEVSPKKHLIMSKKDPFFAALIVCSKDDERDRGGDRFGIINMYASCKKTCAVAESIVYVPRATPHYLLHDHRR